MNIGTNYDYLVVGGGSAGCVLANRLSSDPKTSVLLIEAGGSSRSLFQAMPLAVPFFFHHRRINWSFISEPEPGLRGREVALPRGRLVGGCSAMNGMTFARGHRLDYDDWAANGAAGWSFDEVLPYFRRLETSWSSDIAYHGHDGPLSVEQADTPRLLFEALRDAAVSAGLPDLGDYHAANREGVVRSELTTRRGRRCGTRDAYLDPVRHRRNLTVLENASVGKVVISGSRATAVEVRVNGENFRVAAAREVVLAAGAYGSPQLLMLSGIGPAANLTEMGINVVRDSPGVGRNLIEHPTMLMSFETGAPSFVEELRIDRAMVSAARWLLTGRGPFATNGCNANIFFRTNCAEDRPDIQLMCTALSLGAALWGPFTKPPKHQLGALVTLLRQASRGQVSLQSPDPFARPRIALNLLSEWQDVERIILAIRRARDIYSQPALARRGTKEMLPGPEYSTDHALEQYLRDNINIAHHPVGTCRMGTDHAAVVTPELKVIGIDALRVVDASVMPTIPGGNTNAPTIMVAEKASDLIRNRRYPVEDVIAGPVGRIAVTALPHG